MVDLVESGGDLMESWCVLVETILVWMCGVLEETLVDLVESLDVLVETFLGSPWKLLPFSCSPPAFSPSTRTGGRPSGISHEKYSPKSFSASFSAFRLHIFFFVNRSLSSFDDSVRLHATDPSLFQSTTISSSAALRMIRDGG